MSKSITEKEIEEVNQTIEKLGKDVQTLLSSNPDLKKVLSKASLILADFKQVVAPDSRFAKELGEDWRQLLMDFDLVYERVAELIVTKKVELEAGLDVNTFSVLEDLERGFIDLLGIAKAMVAMKKSALWGIEKRFGHDVELARYGAHPSQVREVVRTE